MKIFPVGKELIFFFEKILSGIQSECQTVWIQIRDRPGLGSNCLQRLSADDIVGNELKPVQCFQIEEHFSGIYIMTL